jgi:hypothetical protein
VDDFIGYIDELHQSGRRQNTDEVSRLCDAPYVSLYCQNLGYGNKSRWLKQVFKKRKLLYVCVMGGRFEVWLAPPIKQGPQVFLFLADDRI